MADEGLPGPQGQGDGCVVVAIRLPVQIIAVAIMLPLRLLWELLRPVGRGLRSVGRCLLAVGRLLWHYLIARPLVLLWRYVLAPLGRVLIVIPARRLGRCVLRPVLTAVGRTLAFLFHHLVVRPGPLLWRYVLVPVWRGLSRLLRVLVAIPLEVLWKWVILPVGRVVSKALSKALLSGWRGAGRVLPVVGLVLLWLLRGLVLVPVTFVWRRAGRPFFRAMGATGRWIGRNVLRPVREAVADARRTVRVALFGVPKRERRRRRP